MSPRRALLEAAATVLIPSAVLWGFLVYMFTGTPRSSGDYVVVLVLMALTSPLIYPIYRRYRRGTPYFGYWQTPRGQLIVGILCALVGSFFAWQGVSGSYYGRGVDGYAVLVSGIFFIRASFYLYCAFKPKAVNLSIRPDNNSGL